MALSPAGIYEFISYLHFHPYIQLWTCWLCITFNSSPPGQNGRRLADGIFEIIYMNEKFCILIQNLTEACS